MNLHQFIRIIESLLRIYLVKRNKGKRTLEDAMERYFTEVKPKDLATLESEKHADFLAQTDMSQGEPHGLIRQGKLCGHWSAVKGDLSWGGGWGGGGGEREGISCFLIRFVQTSYAYYLRFAMH